MWSMIWPIAIVVTGNVFYNIFAKSMPQDANPFLALIFTYLTSAPLCILAYFLYPGRESLSVEISRLNWVAVALGMCLVALEVGNIFVYRAGWKISVASLTANILLAIILVIVGVLFYKEGMSLKQLAGIALCFDGLFLITQK